MEQSTGGRRVAFFGGSFDPPHQGHLAVARVARAALALDTVLFTPVGAQPLKPLGSTAGFEDRLAMTRLAIAGDPGFAVSLLDAPKPVATPNYTLDTLLQLDAGLPPDGMLFCLMGADSFLGLRQWHRAAEIPFVAPLIVASRPGQPLDDLRAALPEGLTMEPAAGSFVTGPHSATQNPVVSAIALRAFQLRNTTGQVSPFYLLPWLHIEISASQIRQRLREEALAASQVVISGTPVLSEPVLDYIRSHRLYQ
ncbi:MAG TPA: nicotinate-nucleotide adenylyltransferase [Terracidiphilus sp.]|jgi:nicotinate-nucleotide adenylyltransferase